MKHKRVFIFGFLIVTIGLFSFLFLPRVSADSGWDGSYDSGSSWSSGSGSGWSSGSTFDSSSGSYSSSGRDIGELYSIIYAVFTIIFLILYVQYKIQKSKTADDWMKVSSKVNMNEFIPNFDFQKFQFQAFSIYEKIQEAWMNFDYDNLRKYVTDEMFNMYQAQLIALKAKQQQNIMKDFTLLDFAIASASKVDNTIVVTVHMNVTCYDYVIDRNNFVIRGNSRIKVNYVYEMTFIKGISTKPNVCPNCQAPLENVQSNICPYCHFNVISEQYDWLLSKKQVLYQTKNYKK